MSNKIVVNCIVFIVLSFSWLFGEDTWIKSYDSSINADSYVTEDVLICLDGGFAINGYFQTYDPPYENEKWGFLIKTDCNGNLLWAKQDTVSFMSESESDAFVETSDGGFISAVSNMWGGTALIKRNSSGTREWVIDGAGLYSESMINSSDGDIVLGGRYNENPALRKINEAGQILWNQNYILVGEGNGKILSLVEMSDGSLAATGGIIDDNTDLFILKTNNVGDSLWSYTYDAYGYYDEGRSIIVNDDKLIITALIGIPNTSNIIMTFNIDGFLLNTQEFETNNPFSLLTSSDNSFVHYSYIGYYQTVITKLDSNYNILWQNIIDSYPAIGDRTIINSETGFVCGLLIYPSNIGLAKLNSEGQVVSTIDDSLSHNDIRLTNYPNPFNPTTTISFDLPEESKVKIEIYNIKGQKVKTLANDKYQTGNHQVIWNGTDENNKSVGSGVYFYKMETADVTVMKKCLLLK